MSFKGLIAGSLCVLVAVVACGVESSVEAKDYDQTCSSDGDCVLVEELRVEGTSCTISCPKSAIHRKDQEKFQTELREERGGCTQVSQPECAISGAAACVQGKCTIVSPPNGDAGAD
jgi:hypothetical protein